MSDHECFRCEECGLCPVCAEDALDRAFEEADRLRKRLDQYEAYDITVDSALRDRERADNLQSRLDAISTASTHALMSVFPPGVRP